MAVEEVETLWKQQQYADGVVVALLCDCSNRLLLLVRLPSLDFTLIHASPSRELLSVRVRWDSDENSFESKYTNRFIFSLLI